jgi:hypothetical protein
VARNCKLQTHWFQKFGALVAVDEFYPEVLSITVASVAKHPGLKGEFPTPNTESINF